MVNDMTETIQSQLIHNDPRRIGPPCVDHARRRSFLVHAAALYGVHLEDRRIDELARSDDDVAAVRGAFPLLSDVEVHEALWALGRSEDGRGS